MEQTKRMTMITSPIELYALDRKVGGRSKRWVNEEEGELLAEIAVESGARIFYESGTANGISACWVAEKLPDLEIHTFDPIERIKVWNYNNVDFGSFIDNIQWHQDRFSTGLEKAFRPGVRALWFIDGDHSTEGLREDWDAMEPRLQSGDVVVFHDLNIEAVHRFWVRAILPKYKTATFPTRRIVGVMYA